LHHLPPRWYGHVTSAIPQLQSKVFTYRDPTQATSYKMHTGNQMIDITKTKLIKKVTTHN